METDLQMFIELYEKFGIELKAEINVDGNYEIRMGEGDYSELDGYSGFFTDIEFDREGKFIRQGFWE